VGVLREENWDRGRSYCGGRKACFCLGGSYGSEKLLTVVPLLDLCNALEELSDDEKTAEILPITVQQIYVLAKLGKIQEAKKLSSEISIEKYEVLFSQGHINSNTNLTLL
jgi:hypothetical protein